MFNMKFDKVVEEVVGFGVPGLIFIALVATSPYAGAAAITFALSSFGPAGMIGGLISLPVAILIAKAVSKYGIEAILKAALKQMKKDGHTKKVLIKKVKGYKISEDLKKKLIEAIESYFEDGVVNFR